jgi:hypothetical protein
MSSKSWPGEREAVIQVSQGNAEAIRLVNEVAEKYFVGNAQVLKQLEIAENSLRENAKMVIPEHDTFHGHRANQLTE